MTQGDAKVAAQQLLYTMTALQIMRARIADLRSKDQDASALLFLGRNLPLLQELNHRWDALPELKGVPRPCEIWSWL